MTNNEKYHIPVLLNSCIDGLNIKPGNIYVDVTFGGGGHSRLIHDNLKGLGHLYSFDQDEDAADNCWKAENFTFIASNFKYMSNHLKALGVHGVDGIIADLGVSSHQFNQFERGFSFRENADLDMRMNRNSGITAADVINGYEEDDLVSLFKKYGELSQARKIASKIIAIRASSPIKSTHELIDIVSSYCPARKQNQFFAQVFQALRIEVNGELDALESLLVQAKEMLNKDGRLVVMSYHSLEDRMVKKYLKKGSFDGEEKKDFYGNSLKPFTEINRKVMVPSDQELIDNPRSRSARLRIAKRNGR